MSYNSKTIYPEVWDALQQVFINMSRAIEGLVISIYSQMSNRQEGTEGFVLSFKGIRG